MKLFLLGIVVTLAVLVGAGLIAVYTGVYNVAADIGHTTVETWILRTAMTQSVKARAGGIMPPSDLDSDHRLHDGFHLFDEMCVECHGVPGKKPGEVGVGLTPKPPDLTRAARRWTASEIFWIVNHGIKATGMPAFGKTHTDEQLWNIVALVQNLPAMTEEEYKSREHGGVPQQQEHQHRH